MTNTLNLIGGRQGATFTNCVSLTIAKIISSLFRFGVQRAGRSVCSLADLLPQSSVHFDRTISTQSSNGEQLYRRWLQ